MVVQFDFLIIIRLLSLTSPFRFDNSWKRLSSSQSYQPLRVPHTPPFIHELKAVTFYINVHYKNTSGISGCIYIYIIINTSWQVSCAYYMYSCCINNVKTRDFYISFVFFLAKFRRYNHYNLYILYYIIVCTNRIVNETNQKLKIILNVFCVYETIVNYTKEKRGCV